MFAGVSLPADSENDGGSPSDWIPTLARFGIPYTTRRGKVAFWDAQRARTVPDEEVAKQLAGGLFLDAEGARILAGRGYGKYLGVSVGGGIIDGSMTELIRPALYQAYHAIENLSNTEGREYYDVVGPVCESSDVFAKNIELPTTHRGDIIAIRSAGAYGESMASCYNSRPLPQSIFSDEIE